MLLEEVWRIRDIPHPSNRAKEATFLLREIEAAGKELSEIRQEAVRQLSQAGRSYRKIAKMLGVSPGRIGQLMEQECDR